MARIYNFSAGPAALPLEVLEQAQSEMLDWQGSGMSVTEMSHRGKEFTAIAQRAEADLRQLLGIPESYQVLFLQGGATSQFAAIPMNLLRGKTTADYLNTGTWSQKAIAEAKRYGAVNVAASAEDRKFTYAPAQSALRLDPNAAYVHYTPNETIHGVEFDYLPDTAGVPLVADFSSTILSRPIDVSRYGLIYAGAQKNMGPAGLTLVIVRDDLLGEALPLTPTLFNYQTLAKNGSMYNTPPTYAWYLAGLVFQWLLKHGGLTAMAAVNQRKATSLYAAIDASGLYSNPVALANRSWMNVPFILADPGLDAAFLAGAKDNGLVGLKGHRSVGGMRASIYNAVTEAGVNALIAYMAEFERTHG